MMALALLSCSPVSWVSKSQSIYGVPVSSIVNQMDGGAAPADPRAELSMLWHYNPNAATEAEQVRGLNGGITWSWDEKLCDDLLPLFYEDILCAAASRAPFTIQISPRHSRPRTPEPCGAPLAHTEALVLRLQLLS